MTAIWGIGAAIIFLSGFIYMAWADGQGEYIEHDEWVMSILMAAAFWPVIIGCVVAVAPFLALYHLIRWVSSARRGTKKYGSKPQAAPLDEEQVNENV